MPADEYEDLKSRVSGLERCEYALAHNIIYGALAYADDFGFKPHKDFSTARFVLEEDDEDTELIEIEFGLNGKPCYMSGPYDDELKIRQITQTLSRTAGEGNFDFIHEVDGDEFDDDDELVFDEFEDADDDELDEEAINELAEVLAEEMVDAFKGYLKVFKKINTSYNKIIRTPEDIKILNQSKIGKKYALDDIATEYDNFDSDGAEDEYDRLYDIAMIDHNYPEVIKGALKAIKKYPGSPKFRKILQFAYTFNDEPDKTDAAIVEEYRLYPGYLLAKIAYANLLIQLNRLNELPAVFDNKADLDELYPDRDVFSYEEAAAFYGCMCQYFTRIDDIDSADKYMNALIKHKLLTIMAQQFYGLLLKNCARQKWVS